MVRNSPGEREKSIFCTAGWPPNHFSTRRASSTAAAADPVPTRSDQRPAAPGAETARGRVHEATGMPYGRARGRRASCPLGPGPGRASRGLGGRERSEGLAFELRLQTLIVLVVQFAAYAIVLDFTQRGERHAPPSFGV